MGIRPECGCRCCLAPPHEVHTQKGAWADSKEAVCKSQLCPQPQNESSYGFSRLSRVQDSPRFKNYCFILKIFQI